MIFINLHWWIGIKKQQQMKITKLFFFLTTVLLMACESDTASKERWYQAEDYVFIGDFTTGLEGPCIDKEGNLFFVNPKRNGTIGKVSNKGQFELFIDTLFVGSVIKSPMSLVDSVFTEAVVKLSFVNSADTAPPPDIEAALSPFAGKKALKLLSSPKLSNSSV